MEIPEIMQGQLCKARINGQWRKVIYYRKAGHVGEHYVWTWEEYDDSRLERIVNDEIEIIPEGETREDEQKRVVNHQDDFKSRIRQSYKGLRATDGKVK